MRVIWVVLVRGMLPYGHPHSNLPGRTADHKTPVTHQIGKSGNRLTSFRSLSHLNKTGLRRFPEVEMVYLALFRSDGEKLRPTRERERRDPTGDAGREIDLRDRSSGVASPATARPQSCGRPTRQAAAPSASALTTSPPRLTPPSMRTGIRPSDGRDDIRQRVDGRRRAIELAAAMVGHDERHRRHDRRPPWLPQDEECP